MAGLLMLLAMCASLAGTKGQSQINVTETGQVDFSQLDPLGSGIMSVQTMTPIPCQSRPHRERHMYEEYIPGFEWVPRFCPPGTLYSSEDCACHKIDLEQVFICRPELLIEFTGNAIEDSSGNQIIVVNQNVLNYQDAGRFDGTGTLLAAQYSKQSFGTKLTIMLRFYKTTGGSSNDQVLMSNCLGGMYGSVEIVLDLMSREIIFRVETKIDSTTELAELRHPFTEGMWQNVKLMYDGSVVTAEVDGSSKTAPLQGNINTRYNGMMIGSCHGRGFVGYLDDVRLYRCLVK